MTERNDDGIVDEQEADVRDADAQDVDDQDVDDQDADALDDDRQSEDDRDADEANGDGSEHDELDDDEMSAVDSMREMIEYIARALASNPDAVSVTEEDGGDRIYLHLSVDDQDKGKVIGRDGRVAQSMRSLLRVAAVKANTRISLEID